MACACIHSSAENRYLELRELRRLLNSSDRSPPCCKLCEEESNEMRSRTYHWYAPAAWEFFPVLWAPARCINGLLHSCSRGRNRQGCKLPKASGWYSKNQAYAATSRVTTLRTMTTTIRQETPSLKNPRQRLVDSKILGAVRTVGVTADDWGTAATVRENLHGFWPVDCPHCMMQSPVGPKNAHWSSWHRATIIEAPGKLRCCPLFQPLDSNRLKASLAMQDAATGYHRRYPTINPS